MRAGSSGPCLICVCLALGLGVAGEAGDALARARRAGYPHFRGPTGGGAALDSGLELVDDWTHARLAWCSEARNPMPPEHTVLWANQIYPPWPMNCENAGGFAGPALAGDRVYVAYYRPTGTASVSKGRGAGTDSALIDADDCLACIDLATGRTLWTTTWEGTGANLRAVEARDGQITPCVAGDRVLFLGSIGRLYCADAATGAKCWDLVATGKARMWEWYKAELMAGRQRPRSGDPPWKEYKRYLEERRPHPELGGSGGRNFNATPVVSGPVAVFGVCHDLVGVELATGKLLWQHGGVLTSSTSPVVWRHAGAERIVAYGRGRLTCVDPVSGEVVWVHRTVGGSYQGHTPAIAGDHLVCTARASAEKRADYHVAGFRLTPAGAEKLWTFPPGTRLTYNSPVIYRGRAYFVTRVTRRGVGGRQVSRGQLLYCVDMETGEVLGTAPGPRGCASLLAMDDRVYHASGCRQWYFGATPDDDGRLPLLGSPRTHNADSTTPAGAAGFLLRRGVDNMVYCFDLRTDQAERAPAEATCTGDPADAAYRLDLAGALADRRDLRLHLVARAGAFPQAWATADGHTMPEILHAGALHLIDGHLRGTVDCWVSSRSVDYHGRRRSGGRHYRFALDAALDAGRIAGTWSEVPIERTHFARVRGRFASLAIADEHHVDHGAGALAGRYADRIGDLGLADYDPRLRGELAAVRRLGRGDGETLARHARESAYPVVRRTALRRLRGSLTVGGNFRAALERVNAVLEDRAHHDEHLSVRLVAVGLLDFNHLLFPRLLVLLDDPEPLIRQAALVSISRILENRCEPPPPALLAAVRERASDPDLRVRAGAVVTLGDMGPSVADELAEVLETAQDVDTCEEAFHALARVAADKAAFLALPVDLRARLRSAVMAAVERPGIDAAARGDALSLLMRSAEGVACLEGLCAAAYPDAVRVEALVQLGRAGFRAYRAIPVLLATAAEAEDPVRRQALISLADICADERAPVPALPAELVAASAAIVAPGQGYVPRRIVYNVRRLLKRTRDARPRLEELARGADEGRARVAAELLRELAEEEEKGTTEGTRNAAGE